MLLFYFSFFVRLIKKKMSELKALNEGFHITYAIDNCKNKVETQKVLDSLTNIFLVKAYHATINPDHFCFSCFKCRLHDQTQDTLLPRDSSEFRLDYNTDFQKLHDFPPYPFYEIYRENIKKKVL